MKKASAAFLILLLLALGTLAAGSAWAFSTLDCYGFVAETAYGDASAAEGIALHERSALAGHLVWDVYQDAETQSRRVDGSWPLSEQYPGARRHECRLNFTFGLLSESYSWNGDGEPRGMSELHAALYAELMRRSGGELDYSATVAASDFMDSLPLIAQVSYGEFHGEKKNAGTGRIVGVEVSDVLRAPVPEGMKFRLGVHPEGNGYEFSVEPVQLGGAGLWLSFDSVLVGGYMYFTLDVHSYETGESVLDAPCAVWRIPAETCGGETVLYAEKMEPFFERGLDGVSELDASCDGERVLLYTHSGGEVWMEAFDPDGGRGCTQRIKLSRSPGSEYYTLYAGAVGEQVYVLQFSGEDYAVFVLWDEGRTYAVAMDYAEGVYTPRLVTDVTSEHILNGSEVNFVGGTPADCIWDGERLYTLYAEKVISLGGGEYRICYVLLTHGRDGEEYAGWYIRPGGSVFLDMAYEAELVLTRRGGD